MGAVAAKELRSLLLTPFGWGLLGAVTLVQALVLFRLTQHYQAHPVVEGMQAGVSYNVGSLYFGAATYVGMLVVPLVTMGQFAGERQRGTWPLLATAPVGAWGLTVGKFVGVTGYLILLMGLLAMLPLSLAGATDLDGGMLLAAWLGALLSLATYAAIGLYLSSLSPSPALAAVATVFVLLGFWLLEMLATTGVPLLDRALAALSLFGHLEPLLRGQVRTADLAFFLTVGAAALALTALRAARLREVE